MAVKQSKRGKPKGSRVNVHEPSGLRAWARYWGCSQQDVREAVKISGAMAVDVQQWLKLHVARPAKARRA